VLGGGKAADLFRTAAIWQKRWILVGGNAGVGTFVV
jgi:hypothetical protein